MLGRILMTEDTDFGELVIRRRLTISGVILLELDRLSNAAEAQQAGEVIATLVEALEGKSHRDRAGPFSSAPATGLMHCCDACSAIGSLALAMSAMRRSAGRAGVMGVPPAGQAFDALDHETASSCAAAATFGSYAITRR